MSAAIIPLAILVTNLGQQAGPAVVLPAALTGEWTLVADQTFGWLSVDGKEATVSLSGADLDGSSLQTARRHGHPWPVCRTT